jgi:hypothetical protein
MPIFTYIKIGTAVLIAAILGYFVLEYQHRGNVITALKVQAEQLKAATAYYEKQPAIDAKTQEVNDEINKAVDAGDVDRVRELYQRMHNHQRAGKGKPSAPPKHGDADRSGDQDDSDDGP